MATTDNLWERSYAARKAQSHSPDTAGLHRIQAVSARVHSETLGVPDDRVGPVGRFQLFLIVGAQLDIDRLDGLI